IDSPSSYGEWEMNQAAASGAMITEAFCFGPRMVWQGMDGLRSRPLGESALLDRAAEVVHTLLRGDEGVCPTALLRAGETLADLTPVVRYLEQHEWVGVASRRNRLWLLTDARRDLIGPIE